MSRNISEETPGKTIAAQGFGVRQLFRRPAVIPEPAEEFIPEAFDWVVAIETTGPIASHIFTLTGATYAGYAGPGGVNAPLGPSFDVDGDFIPYIIRRGVYLAIGTMTVNFAPGTVADDFRYVGIELGNLVPDPGSTKFVPMIGTDGTTSVSTNGGKGGDRSGSFTFSARQFYPLFNDPSSPTTPDVDIIWYGDGAELDFSFNLKLIRIAGPMMWRSGVLLGTLDELG